MERPMKEVTPFYGAIKPKPNTLGDFIPFLLDVGQNKRQGSAIIKVPQICGKWKIKQYLVP